MVQQTLDKQDERIQQLSAVINRQIANFQVLYMKLHHFHWYIKGANFFTLHAKFEELYTEVSQHLDEMAERLLTIGGQPISSLKQCLELTTLSEAAGEDTEQKMVEATCNDFMTINNELSEAIKGAQNFNDDVTEDLFLGIKASFEKHIWMLNFYLNK